MKVMEFKRTSYCYVIRIPRTGRMRSMIYCEKCGKISAVSDFALSEQYVTCPKCNASLTNLVEVPKGGYTFFNYKTQLFVNENGVTITCVMMDITRHANTPFPVIGKMSFLMKFSFRRDGRATMYMKNTRTPGDVWKKIKPLHEFVNITQPIDCLPRLFDIVIPKEICNRALKELGSKYSVEEDILPYELAWMVRTKRDYYAAMNIRLIYNVVRERVALRIALPDGKEVGSREYYNYLRKILRNGDVSKISEMDIMEALLAIARCESTVIDKPLIKDYYKNPWFIPQADIHRMLFRNIDMRRNIMKFSMRSVYGIYRRTDSKWVSIMRFMPFAPTVSREDIDMIYLAFGGNKENRSVVERRIYDKFKTYPSYDILRDTARMIVRLKDMGLDVKTKGNLEELHGTLSMLYNKLSRAHCSFLYAAYVPDWVYEHKDVKLTFKFAKDTLELIDIGEKMSICVGSYGHMCMGGGTIIAYAVNEKNEPVICLEINNNPIPTLEQAKCIYNALPKANYQKAIYDFCNAHGIMIRTHDMNADYRERSKSFIKEHYLNGTLPMDVFKLPFKLRDEKIKMDLIYRTLGLDDNDPYGERYSWEDDYNEEEANRARHQMMDDYYEIYNELRRHDNEEAERWI